jgi:hypothetical protein
MASHLAAVHASVVTSVEHAAAIADLAAGDAQFISSWSRFLRAGEAAVGAGSADPPAAAVADAAAEDA